MAPDINTESIKQAVMLLRHLDLHLSETKLADNNLESITAINSMIILIRESLNKK